MSVRRSLFFGPYLGKTITFYFGRLGTRKIVRYASKIDNVLDADERSVMVIQPRFKEPALLQSRRMLEYQLGEAVGLAEAVSGWQVVDKRIVAVREHKSPKFFGKGTHEELAPLVRSMKVKAVFVNCLELLPIQEAYLKKIWKVMVYDRFQVVLKIFKERARTREAKLQVQLAEIPYMKARLVEGVDMTDRQQGRTDSLGGVGETTVDAAKRRLSEQGHKLKKELLSIKDKRQLLRTERVRKAIPTVAVIGYTNCGKTSLIKAITKDSMADGEDLLFATLDTTVHAGKLPSGMKVVFVDTVGFVSNLPPELVQSFHATLDDVVHADVVLHVRDISHPFSEAQRTTVLDVIRRLRARGGRNERILEVWNKADIKPDVVPSEKNCCLVSATKATGLRPLLEKVEEAVLEATGQRLHEVLVPANGPQLSWLYREATVCSVTPCSEEGNEELLKVNVLLSDSVLSKYKARNPWPCQAVHRQDHLIGTCEEFLCDCLHFRLNADITTDFC